mmetsp:Transcript_10223/g.20479  ORF Transcript_10223/g.20479 Transcript_10223/m.20479 type:complete len:114 (+) Transcript_10223:363-704(+)
MASKAAQDSAPKTSSAKSVLSSAAAGTSRLGSNSVRKSLSAVQSVRDLMKKDDITWEQICDVEKRRRAILRRTELPFWRMLFFWDGTVLQALARDTLMWLTMIIYSKCKGTPA